ncbi:MAG: site-specific integrase [Alphaproteobacteria bacterium]|nr:site-specific integrase [Alphaproteobacteria bacterium]
MRHVVNHQVVLSQAPEGPLAPWIEGYADAASRQGYALSSIGRRIRLAAGFSRWLGQEGIDLSCISSDHPAQYLRYRTHRVRLHHGDAAALRHLVDFLRLETVIPAETLPLGPETEAERCVLAYEQYLSEARGLAPTTILNYTLFARAFVQYRFGTGQVTISCLRAGDVVGFVQHEAPRMNNKRAKLMTTALRSFLHYVRYRDEGMPDLAAAVPVVANWSMDSVPRAISADRVHRLLTSIDRTTAMGRRDYAILLLFARLGLRLSEVAFLELDDVDWRTATLQVRAKGGIRNDFPLSHEIGEAIADYLRHGRPCSDSRRVFLRVRAPICGFRGPSGVGSVIRHTLERAGIDAPTRGAHQFRHGLSTEMMRQGASLGEIGDVLGHRHPDTTRIYAKVNLEALRPLALPWPGGAR